MGFGRTSRLHTTRILRLSEDLPLVNEIVDTEEKITAFLSTLDEMTPSGLVSLEKVQVPQYGEHVKHEPPEMHLDASHRRDSLQMERQLSSLGSRGKMAQFEGPAPVSTRATTLQALVAAAEASITEPSAAEQTILARLDEALARTAEGRLRVAMLGQFKRGKSTLLNALLGVPLLPTGITPVTAIPTYVRVASDPLLRIEFEGSREPLELSRRI